MKNNSYAAIALVLAYLDTTARADDLCAGYAASVSQNSRG